MTKQLVPIKIYDCCTFFYRLSRRDELSFEHVASKTVTEIHELGRQKHVSFESAAAVHDDDERDP